MDTPRKHRPPLVLALKEIFEGTSEFTGQQFFRSLVKQLAQVLNVHGVWVTEYKEEEHRLNALAFWLDGKFVEKYEYNVKGTPCEPVLEKNDIFHVPNNVIELYPEDPDLEPLGAVSYMGLVLKDTEGKILGHLALLDQEPMEELPEVFVVFKLFATRAAAELRRLQYEKRLKGSESKINRLLNGTMDAIIELNENLEITQANEAASNIFQKKKENFIGKNITHFLEKKSHQKLLDLIPFLNKNVDKVHSQWIPGHLYCVDKTGNSFPAESTISCYQFAEKNFYALHIRDVRDKIQKEEAIKKLSIETLMLQEKVKDHQMDRILGKSPALLNTLHQVTLVAPTDSSVLILGETGTGKELLAQEVHQKSQRKNQPFITLNCAVLPPELIDSELFGHVKGAFTGALKSREGRFSLADKGTLFLDEIGELPLALQAKMLRVIQEGEFEPLGSSLTQKVDVRIIAATHKDLKNEVKEKRFREDLYYRLNVFPIHVPPLRERGQDILLLAQAFLDKYAARHGKAIKPLNEIDRQMLLQYSWPGNVRELQNIIERSVITTTGGSFKLGIDILHSPESIKISSEADRVLTSKELQHLEVKNLELALKKTNGKVFGENGAAKLLGIPATTFKSKLLKYGIDPKSI